MAATRTAEAHWQGTLKEGRGEVELVSSGIGSFEVTWPARTEQPNGLTSPEELIAAAHSTCFSMSVANELVKAGQPTAESIETRADVTFQPGQGITGIVLDVTAVVPGITAEAFQAAVDAAEQSCPVSRALAATPITVEASLAE